LRRSASTERRNVPENSTAFASFEQKWLAAHPEQAAVAVFLAPSERLRTSAFGCLVHELEQTAFGLREAQAAAVKLAWWRQELIGACAGNPRHPISAVLFADPRTQTVDAGSWSVLADGALAMLEQRNASNFTDLLGNRAALYVAVARIESTLFCGSPAQLDAIATLWTISHLLHALSISTEVSERLPLPLDLLARHGLTRSMLTQPGEGRTAALRDYLGVLSEHVGAALAETSGATLGCRVRARLDLAAIRQAVRAPDPLSWLIAHPHVGRWTSLWSAWSEARQLARRR
jgi:phytoene synthase